MEKLFLASIPVDRTTKKGNPKRGFFFVLSEIVTLQLYADTRKKCQAIIKKRSKDFGGTSDAPDVMKLVLEILTTNTNVKLKQKKIGGIR